MKKFYPSSAAFMIGDTVVTKYDSGCLRNILIKSHGIRIPIPEVYARVGAAHELKHAAELHISDSIVNYVREAPIRRELSPTVEYSGRADFVVQYAVIEGDVVHETKGTISKNTRLDVIRKGHWNVNYLAQLVSYMIKLKTNKGKLIHGYYEENTLGRLEHQEGRTFRVLINDEGSILVDSLPSGYTVRDLLAHENAAVKVLETEAIADRPDKWNLKWGGPCTRCPFKSTCDSYDKGDISNVEQFIHAASHAARLAVENAPPDPVPHKVKPPKVKKTPKPRSKKNVN